MGINALNLDVILNSNESERKKTSIFTLFGRFRSTQRCVNTGLNGTFHYDFVAVFELITFNNLMFILS